MALHGNGSVTIADGASLSNAFDLTPTNRLVGVELPSGWTTQSITFQVSLDGTTYVSAYDADGNEIVIPSAVASRFYGLSAAQQVALYGARYVKVRSGTTASPQNQAGGDVIKLALDV